jgi:hypothetical protein
MDIEQMQAIAQIGQSITVTGVLLAWVFHEARNRSKLSDFILDDWNDLRRERMAQKPVSLPNEDE